MKPPVLKTALAGLLIMSVSFLGQADFAARAETYDGLENIVTKTAQLVRAQLVDEGAGTRTADELLRRLSDGHYADIENSGELERRLTEDLRAISGDTHIGIVLDPESVARYRARESAEGNAEAEAENEANKKARAEEARLDNYGIRAVEVLPGGVGYFRIDYFDGHVAESAPVIAAAMNMLASSDAIILDLRRNGGGSSYSLPLFLGYFLGPDPVHLGTLNERWRDLSIQIYSDASVKGARHHDKPLYILTSGTTYSMAEAITYNLKAFDRATIVGERTWGGGNGWDPVVLNDDFYLRIPRQAFVNAKTGTYFVEGEGISPDIAVQAADARKKAYVEALDRLHAAAADAEKRGQIEWALEVANARLNRADEAGDDGAERFAGSYENFVFDARADGLWLSFSDLPFVKLERLRSGLYLDDRAHQRQFLFDTAGDASARAVSVWRLGETPREIARSEAEK